MSTEEDDGGCVAFLLLAFLIPGACIGMALVLALPLWIYLVVGIMLLGLMIVGLSSPRR